MTGLDAQRLLAYFLLVFGFCLLTVSLPAAIIYMVTGHGLSYLAYRNEIKHG
jgi:hypothetical protein